MNEIYNDVEKAIDYVFSENKFVLNLYEYMKIKDFKKVQAQEFISSTTANNIKNIVKELNEYIEGGQDNNHRQLREAYGHIPKPNARKISKYLNSILEDAERFISEKGKRRKKTEHK